MNCHDRITRIQEEVNLALDSRLPSADARPARLHGAIRHSIEVGGKRLRPILLLSAFEVFPSDNDPMPAALAVECLHTYSLIHDDLPAMDDSDLRRGAPSCHKAFDEATAILAGDALLTLAFEILSTDYAHLPTIATVLSRILSSAAGSHRLVAGQMEDLLSEGTVPSLEDLSYIHRNKTAALIACSIEMGLLLGSRGEEEDILELGRRTGTSIGLAFQTVDDLLDVTASSDEIGKETESDEARGKVTSVSMQGKKKAKESAASYTQDAIRFARELGGENQFLIELISYLLERKN